MNFDGVAWKLWASIDKDTRKNITWEAFEEFFSKKMDQRLKNGGYT
jgi:hypothetical protein